MIRLPATLLAIFLAQLAPGPQTVPYYIADGKGVAGYEPADRDLAVLAVEAWSRESGGRVKFTKAVREEDALLRVRWASPDQGLFFASNHVENKDQ